MGDTLSGCWATVGVLTEKGEQRMSSAGKPYCIWKVGSLDEDTVSVFLFGTAYQKYSKDEVGSVFAFLSCGARKDNSVPNFHGLLYFLFLLIYQKDSFLNNFIILCCRK